jgi:hypothetical protein
VFMRNCRELAVITGDLTVGCFMECEAAEAATYREAPLSEPHMPLRHSTGP